MIDEVIRKIMANTNYLLALFNISEYYNFPFEIQQAQFRILEKVADQMNEARAFDIIKRNGLSRLITSHNKHNPRFQPVV